jgi:ribonuclease VapC
VSRPTVVLDASAILAFLFEEPGAATVQGAVGRALVSAVNWAEIAQACLARGADPVAARTALTKVGLEIVPLDVADAEAATDAASPSPLATTFRRSPPPPRG